MRVYEIMHHAVHVGNISVAAAARIMEKENVDSVLVEHDIVGIVTEHDILRKVVARGIDPAKTTVSEIMSYPLHTIAKDESVELAGDLMNEHHIRRLVVEESGKVVGVLSAACMARNIKYITARRLIASRLGETWAYVE